MHAKTRFAAASGAIAIALTLAACGGEDPAAAGGSPSATSTAPTESATVDGAHNDADVAFAQMMIVHHEGAIAMADLAVRNASTEDVKDLAKRISAAQEPEIEEMNSWLTAWGSDPSMDGMDMDGMDMDGTDQDAAMSELESATGDDFDRRFLQLMVEHHRGALDMAEAQLTDGKNPKALELAKTIIDTQQAEIAEMEKLLQKF